MLERTWTQKFFFSWGMFVKICGIILRLFFKMGFIYYLSSCPTSPSSLSPKQRQRWVLPHGMDLCKIRYWLITPTSLCDYCISTYCRRIIILDQRVCRWLGVYISPLVFYRISSTCMKALVRSHLSVSISMSWKGAVFSNRA